jgi:hypothetical protein
MKSVKGRLGAIKQNAGDVSRLGKADTVPALGLRARAMFVHRIADL